MAGDTSAGQRVALCEPTGAGRVFFGYCQSPSCQRPFHRPRSFSRCREDSSPSCVRSPLTSSFLDSHLTPHDNEPPLRWEMQATEQTQPCSAPAMGSALSIEMTIAALE